MGIPTVDLGSLTVSKMILGGNPFSGFSHQGSARDVEMREYYTPERIVAAMRRAERLGVTTAICRADEHIRGVLARHWADGGSLQWIAQTCPEQGNEPPRVDEAVEAGAKAVFIHGGTMDYLLANDRLEVLPGAIDQVRRAGLPVGVAGHDPALFGWAERNLEVDFYMCSYYNPTSRAENASHDSDAEERFCDDDRAAMVEVIATLSKPAIHYKVMAAGRKDPAEALGFVAEHLRDQDAVCIGYYLKDHPDAIGENLRALGLA